MPFQLGTQTGQVPPGFVMFTEPHKLQGQHLDNKNPTMAWYCLPFGFGVHDTAKSTPAAVVGDRRAALSQENHTLAKLKNDWSKNCAPAPLTLKGPVVSLWSQARQRAPFAPPGTCKNSEADPPKFPSFLDRISSVLGRIQPTIRNTFFCHLL